MILGLALSPTLFSWVVSCKQWFLDGGVQGVLYFSLIFCIR
jgi:hypothetical protein